MYTLRDSVIYLDDFLIYFAVALAIFSLFTWVYMRITPYREMQLIREGNVAAAIALSGAMIGFVLPLASVVANSINIVDMLIFSLIAGVVQIVVFLIARRIVNAASGSIESGNVAKGIFIAALAIAVGILNAAALTY